MITKTRLISEDKMEEFMELGNGSPAFIIHMLDIYIKNTQNLLLLCRQSVQNDDFEKLKSHIHTLKGSSLNMGLEQIGEQLKELEENMPESKLSSVKTFFRLFEVKLEEVKHYRETLSNRAN